MNQAANASTARHGHDRGRSALVSRFALYGSVVTLAIILGTAILLWTQYDRIVGNATREQQNLAVALAAHTDRSLQALDLAQGSVIDRIARLSVDAGGSMPAAVGSREFHDVLKEMIGPLSHVEALLVVDAKGSVVNSSRSWPSTDAATADRAYLEAVSSDGTAISAPVRAEAGEWTVYTGRPVSSLRGEFLGTVIGVVKLHAFETLFESLALSDASSISLFRRDGILLARHPHVGASIGTSFAGQKLFLDVLSNADEGAVRQRSLVDGEDRVIAVRALRNYPLVLTVTNTVSAITSQWVREAVFVAGLAGLAVIVIVTALVLGLRQLRAYDLLARARSRQADADAARRVAEAELAAGQERERAAGELAAQYELVRRHQEELKTQNIRFETALRNMSQGLVMFDKDQKLVVCNDRYTEVYSLPRNLAQPGTTQREILEHRVAHGMYDGSDPEQYIRNRVANAARGQASDNILELPNGRTIAVSHRPMPGGGWVATHEDITARRDAEARIAHLAHHDPLTDLPNRVLFRERMQQALTRVERGDELAVLCLDLDHFKNVNDTLGHPVGDLLLQAAAERLRDCVRDSDTVARIGGDEFSILQVGAEQPNGASGLSRRIIEVLSAPYTLDGHQVVIGTSIGVALAPADTSDPDQLLKNADLALYRAKADGRGRYRFFEREMDARMQARRLLEVDLRKAMVAQEFELYFQPLMSLHANEISGFEALLRWNHPERGMVSPAEFIPLCEETGLIVPLGEWVLREACREAATWPGQIKVAVNLSPAQFKSNTLVSIVVSALATSGLLASRLELEITESVLLQDDEANIGILHQLRALGVRISLDDFGTGYSSLSYLRSFPFDKIKIDQSFVRELSSRSDCAAIVQAVASLGSTLGMATTAEGVETLEQLDELRAKGCTEAQGYLFSRPQPAAAVRDLLSSRALQAVA